MYATVLLDGHLAGGYVYRLPPTLAAVRGDWLIVPWGKSRRVGIVATRSDTLPAEAGFDLDRLRDAEALLPDMPRFGADWFDLIDFAAGYYHADPAELALAAIPKLLRQPPTTRTRRPAAGRLADHAPPAVAPSIAPVLASGQQSVLGALCETDSPDHAPWLLQGVTGSGKTELYLHWIARRLAARPDGQVLVLVPEIGLTPALQRQLAARFQDHPLAVLHSEMPDAARAAHWLAAASGRARIVLGTRLAALVPLPRLDAIVVDEEHDPSFRQQEGVRYSARDLAVVRARRAGIPILLGSATPSLESWSNARSGRYRLLNLTERATGAALPRVEIVSMRKAALLHGLTPQAIAAVDRTLARREQVLVFLNRRGYSPVLGCQACNWLSRCDQCDAYRVLHRQPRPAGAPAGGAARYHLVCHHCGSGIPVPKACPDCGNQDLTPLGRGTQRLEEGLAAQFPAARIGRLDRDVASRRGATEDFLASAHAGDLDLMIGTQMLAKGHDFDRLALVLVVDADAGLFAADFRAPERLFATLMQVSGRAGRQRGMSALTLVQTRYPEHPLFADLVRQDYPAFADRQLAERAAHGLPPSGHQALLIAQCRDEALATGFLLQARDALQRQEGADVLTLCDPVPMPLAQLRGQYRAQLLIESPSRPRLHRMLSLWRPALDPLAVALRTRLSWFLVVDPAEI